MADKTYSIVIKNNDQLIADIDKTFDAIKHLVKCGVLRLPDDLTSEVIIKRIGENYVRSLEIDFEVID